MTHGARFEAKLRKLYDGFAALPEAVLKMPLADVLASLDEGHDAWGRAIHFLARAVEEGPKELAPLAPVVALVRERYMPRLSEIQAAYAVQDQRGQDRLARLASDAPALGAVPTPDGRTLRDWIESYAVSGTKLGTTLGQRAEHLAGSSPTPGLASFTELRSGLIGTVGQLRRQIELDLDNDDALPRTLLSDVLGHLDEVVRLSEARAKTGPRAADPSGPDSPPA